MRILFLSFILSFVALFSSSAQSKNEAKALFEQGKYAEAKPLFRALYEATPSNSEYNYWYAVCCLETNDTVDVGAMLEFAVSRRITNAYRYLGDYYLRNHNYVDAGRMYSEFAGKTRSDSLRALARSRQNLADRLVRMVKNTEVICFIDSVVLDEEEFLAAYCIGDDAGVVMSCAEYFEDDDSPGYVNETERGLDVYFSEENEDSIPLLKLYHSSKVGDEWGTPEELQGFDTQGNDNYPYMLSDGVTLYFASDGEGSIGGYDLFMSRMDTETGRFFRPDHLGMPFNSLANDYMLVINDVVNLGWFATDRNQPEGKVCVYLFIPNPERVKYNVDELGYDKVLEYSYIASIASTHTDANAVRNARRQIMMLLYEGDMATREGDFLFVIDDVRDYTKLSDFRSENARDLFSQWRRRSEQLQESIIDLEQMREEYSTAAAQRRNSMREAILDLEAAVESEAAALEEMELEIRRIEQAALYNR